VSRAIQKKAKPRSPWSPLSGELDSAEQDRALTRHIVRVAFQRYREKLRGLIAEYVAIVLVYVPRFSVPGTQATRPRPNHYESSLGLRPPVQYDRPGWRARLPDVGNGSPLIEELRIEPRCDPCHLIVPLGSMFSDISTDGKNQRLPLPYKY